MCKGREEAGLIRTAELLHAMILELSRRLTWLATNDAPMQDILLVANYLDAAMYQRIEGDIALGYLSVGQLADSLRGEASGLYREISRKGITEKELAIQLRKVAEVIHDGELAAAWELFIARLGQEGNLDDLKKLSKLVVQLKELGILPFWAYGVVGRNFIDSRQRPEDVAVSWIRDNKITTWIADWEAEKAAFDPLKTIEAGMKQVQENAFGVPAQFPLALKKLIDLKRGIEAVIGRASAAGSSPLLQAASAGLVESFIDLFDRCIKSLKSSSQWSIEEKLESFFKFSRGVCSFVASRKEDFA